MFGDRCKHLVKDSGKCKTKVPYRYNDYCAKDDCPKQYETPSRRIKQARKGGVQ